MTIFITQMPNFMTASYRQNFMVVYAVIYNNNALYIFVLFLKIIKTICFIFRLLHRDANNQAKGTYSFNMYFVFTPLKLS